MANIAVWTRNEMDEEIDLAQRKCGAESQGVLFLYIFSVCEQITDVKAHREPNYSQMLLYISVLKLNYIVLVILSLNTLSF